MLKVFVSIACLLLVAGSSSSQVEARPKRSVYLAAAPVVAAAPVAVASVPVVQQSHVVQHNPTTVVKTEQVQSGNHASYSYSAETKSQPAVVHTHAHAVAAAPAAVVASPAVAHYAAVPVAHSYTYGYPSSYYSASYYSPYSYVIGK